MPCEICHGRETKTFLRSRTGWKGKCMTGAPMVTTEARVASSLLRSATLVQSGKVRLMLRRTSCRSEASYGSSPSAASQATTETSSSARKISSSRVLQLSTRIASPGRKVSASTSHTVPRWVPILEREKRSSYLQARLSNCHACLVSCFGGGSHAFTSERVESKPAYFGMRQSRLLFEHLRHELRLNLIQLVQRCL